MYIRRIKNIIRPLARIVPLLTVTAFFTAGVVTTACSEDEDCSMTARGMMGCNLFTRSETTGEIIRDTLPLLTVKALVADSVLINQETEVKKLSLPLRYTADSTALQFVYGDEGMADTVIIWHENTPYFLSMDCGYQMKQRITRVGHTRHLLDSIQISNPEVGIYGTENLKLYY